jgi:hypothetical protein
MAPMRPRAMLLALLMVLGLLAGTARAATTTPGPPPSPPASVAPPPIQGTRYPVAGTATGGNVPAPLWVLGILAALAALAALGIVLARVLGWAPAWAPGARHAWGEAGFRAGSRWGDFTDFLRSRR